ncbi:MAG: phosphatidylglycerophosphatase A [Nitrososphaeria archaeon]|nr:phosphatidylglycerophosphatase A [Nitrososphaeria archaeon]NIN53490.1 phosphatidylglycerophosphatase A [Nitrososphaeria archaeon]NIQ34007.1 phosphatidylglycerophosphatase A [Nitrososphaeria archaeon]
MSKAKEKGEIERRLRRLIQSRCEDVNVHLLIRAALYLDDELAEDRVEVEGDPVNLLCDEFLGMSIAEYIGGKSALFNYVRYDMRKPGVLSELGVFLDDVIAGLITGCMTRLF